MITVKIIGIDPYSLRNLSKDLTGELANLCEVDEKDINFYAPEGLLVHDGVEQNTWNVHVNVEAPRKIKVLEQQIADVLAGYVKHIAIHVTVIFNYYLAEERHEYINKEYPVYLTEENEVTIEEENSENDNLEEVYTGNVFENIEEKL